MNHKQRERKLERRHQHHGGSNLPRRILSQETYTTVKQGHIIPSTYQRQFAVDGDVAVHVPGGRCLNLKVEKVGTRRRAYRRTRPDGSEIDDIEASLGVLEARVSPVLRSVAGGEPIDDEAKAGLAQFFAMQMVRGPLFFSVTQEIAEQHVREGITAESASKKALDYAGGAIDTLRELAVARFWDLRFADMLRSGQKLSSILGCMRWQLLSFSGPVVAYSDQPVVVWPLNVTAVDQRPDKPVLGPMNALEVSVPLAPDLVLLMTWEELDDAATPILAAPVLAADFNSLVIAQRDQQWMHHPSSEPLISQRLLKPLSQQLNPGYNASVAVKSVRRTTAAKLTDRMIGRPWVNTVKIITDMKFTSEPVRSESVTKRVRRRPS